MKEFKRCKKCIMPTTRWGIQFNEEGICYPCLYNEKQKSIDWSERWLELDELCSQHRNRDKPYDCVICVSGGKDSTYLVHTFKKLLNMNPLCVMVDNATWTDTGRANFYNISEVYDVDIITFTSKVKTMKDNIRSDFFTTLRPMQYWDEVLYRKPLEIAEKFGIGLVIWGENTHIHYGGSNAEETPNAKLWLKDPTEFTELDVIFTSYYIPWSRSENVRVARLNGFKGLIENEGWDREGYIEMFQYDQCDGVGYLTNQYLSKFIRGGFSSMTELCSVSIREGLMTREEAMEIVRENDWKLDPIMMKDFIDIIGISETEFWNVVDKFANRDVIEMVDGHWKVKEVLNV